MTVLEAVVQDDGGRGDLTEEQWQKLPPLLAPQKAWTGQPGAEHRRRINGIWRHRTAAAWRDLPERDRQHSTIGSRFYRWRIAGWQQIWENLGQQADASGEIDGEVDFVDSTVVRAHQHAESCKSGEPEVPALGRS